MSPPDNAALLSIVHRIQLFPELAGCQVGYYGSNYARVLVAPYPESGVGSGLAIVIERSVLSDADHVGEVQRLVVRPGGSPDGAPNPSIVTNHSRLGAELIGVGWNCGLTVGSLVLGAAGIATEIPTGGASSFLIVASWTGVATGGLLCLNGLVRVATAVATPDSDSLEEWDRNSWYAGLGLFVDGLGVVANLASLPFAVQKLWAIIARQRSFLARNLTLETLRAMTRRERMTVMRSVVDEAGRTAEGRDAILNAMRDAKLAPEIVRMENLSIKNARKLQTVVSDETIRRLHASLSEVLLNLGTYAGSASPSEYTASASGSINWLIHVLDANGPR